MPAMDGVMDLAARTEAAILGEPLCAVGEVEAAGVDPRDPRPVTILEAATISTHLSLPHRLVDRCLERPREQREHSDLLMALELIINDRETRRGANVQAAVCG